MDPKTICARAIRNQPEPGHALAPNIVPASTFGMESQAAVDRHYATGQGYLYARYASPTVRLAETMLAELEGAEDTAVFASGMAAISTTILTLLGSGGRVAAQRELYGGSVELFTNVLPDLGLDVLWLTRDELAELSPSAIRGCSLLFLETPVNPTLRLIDLQRATSAAHEAGALVAVDSTFATPVLQRPLEHGVDLVLHSATKYLGGHADLVGGAVCGSGSLIAQIAQRRRSLGGIMDPFTAFLLHRGMRTLAVRMEAHCRGAEAVARWLAGHPRVETVNYPGLDGHPDAGLRKRQMAASGGMVSFTIAGGAEAAERVHDRVRLVTRAASLGGVESLVSIPARMSHRGMAEPEREAMGVPRNMLRLSVGLEAPGDLIADLDQALAGDE